MFRNQIHSPPFGMADRAARSPGAGSPSGYASPLGGGGADLWGEASRERVLGRVLR